MRIPPHPLHFIVAPLTQAIEVVHPNRNSNLPAWHPLHVASPPLSAFRVYIPSCDSPGCVRSEMETRARVTALRLLIICTPSDNVKAVGVTKPIKFGPRGSANVTIAFTKSLVV